MFKRFGYRPFTGIFFLDVVQKKYEIHIMIIYVRYENVYLRFMLLGGKIVVLSIFYI